MSRTLPAGTVGLFGLLAGIAISAYGLGKYEAWWTIAFLLGGIALAAAEDRGVRPIPAVVAGVAIACAIAIGMLGLFLLALSSIARGSGLTFLALGAVAFVGALVVLGAAVRYVRPKRIQIATPDEIAPRDGA